MKTIKTIKTIKTYQLIIVGIFIIMFSSCRKDNIDPNDIDLSTVKQTCIKFNSDSLSIEGPVWRIMYKHNVILYFPNQDEAKQALEVIQRNHIDEQCKIGDGVLTTSDGKEKYHDNVMYYYLTKGEAPSVASDKDDYLIFDVDDIKARQSNGEWTIVEGGFLNGHAMFSFGCNKTDCENAVKVLKKFRFDRECFVGRPYPSMNFFIKTRTVIHSEGQGY